jgi:hypothetical protein
MYFLHEHFDFAAKRWRVLAEFAMILLPILSYYTVFTNFVLIVCFLG